MAYVVYKLDRNDRLVNQFAVKFQTTMPTGRRANRNHSVITWFSAIYQKAGPWWLRAQLEPLMAIVLTAGHFTLRSSFFVLHSETCIPTTHNVARCSGAWLSILKTDLALRPFVTSGNIFSSINIVCIWLLSESVTRAPSEWMNKCDSLSHWLSRESVSESLRVRVSQWLSHYGTRKA